MASGEIRSRTGRAEFARAAHALRYDWRTASLAGGWPFVDDWALPEIDQVCCAVLSGKDLAQPLTALGRARASAGIGLGETLADLAALHAVLDGPDTAHGVVGVDPDAPPARLLRLTALGWADSTMGRLGRSEVTDPLTGLATAEYLRMRLSEVYREAEVSGRSAADTYALVAVRHDPSGLARWPRLAATVLVADALRATFTSGETLVALGRGVAAGLARRDELLAGQVARLRRLAAQRLSTDQELRGAGRLRVDVHRLPAGYRSAGVWLGALRSR
ncbi:MAG: GGDEF domain-containing protein [Sciscionella sp.]